MASFALFSCSHDDPEPEDEFDPDTWIIHGVYAPAPDPITVSFSDLDNVAGLFSSDTSKSRAGEYTSSTIFSQSGEPCLYVLNFNQGGWAIVSATRKYKPILAFSDQGEFNIAENLPEEIEIWKQIQIETISNVDNLVSPDSIALYQSEWNRISPISEIQPMVDH